MFCDGKCETKKETEEGTVVKRCGMFETIFTKDNISGDEEIRDACVLKEMCASSLRLEKANIRLQAAIESARNEDANWSQEMNNTIANGFMGVMYSVTDDEKRFKVVKRLKEAAEKVVELKKVDRLALEDLAPGGSA